MTRSSRTAKSSFGYPAPLGAGYPWPVSHTAASGGHEPLPAREPERDLPRGGLVGIGPVHQVVLRLQGVVGADAAGCRLLDWVGAAGDLPERRERGRGLD